MSTSFSPSGDVTPWFPASVRPVRVGLYQRNYGDPRYLNKVPDYWDGFAWLVVTIDGNRFFTNASGLQWRGLRQPPTGLPRPKRSIK